MVEEAVIAGNVYDKYNAKNPIARLLMKGFIMSFQQLVSDIPYKTVLDTGCGEAYLTQRFLRDNDDKVSFITGIDISLSILESAVDNCPDVPFVCASAYTLPFADERFDLVVASEFLEHVHEPEVAIKEINRVGKEYFLFSVPQEPIWRVLNLCRLQYVRRLGNTPGHVRHWSKSGFIRLISKTFDIVEVRAPFPWTMILCKKKRSAQAEINGK